MNKQAIATELIKIAEQLITADDYIDADDREYPDTAAGVKAYLKDASSFRKSAISKCIPKHAPEGTTSGRKGWIIRGLGPSHEPDVVVVLGPPNEFEVGMFRE